MASKFRLDREKCQRDLLTELVAAETPLDTTSSDFKRLHDVVSKKLPNNRYGSVNPREVERTIDGLCTKFNVSSQRELADEFKAKSAEYLAQGDENTDREDIDIEHAVMHFLLLISENPVNKTYEPDELDDEESLEEEIDWHKILVEDLDLSEESEEDWSSDGDEIFVDDEEVYEYHSPVKIPKKKDEFIDAEIPSYADICGSLMKQYWRDYTVREPTSVPFSQRIISPSYKVLTELQIIREIVTMLQGAPTSYVFYCEEGNVHLRQDLTTSHYSYDALNSILRYFHEKISMVQSLHYLCDDVSEFVSQPEHPYGSRTFQSFSCAIVMYLYQLNESLSDIETKVKEQREIVTMTALREAVREHFEIITALYEMVQEILMEVVIDSPSVCVTALFNILYETLQLYESMGVLTEHITKVLLTIMLCTLQPLLTTIDIWLTHGDLNNSTGEIFVTRDPDISPFSREFWNAGLTYKQGIAKSKQIPGILISLSEKMLKAGKAIEMIKNLGKLGVPDVDLFKALVQKYLGKDFPVSPLPSSPSIMPVPSVQQPIDALLLANFADLTNGLKKSELKTVPMYTEIWGSISKLHIIPSAEILKILIPLVDKRCTQVSFSLLSNLRDHFHLDQHLSTLRKVFLMEAGLPMSMFCHELFKSVYKGERLRDMTPFLRECLVGFTDFAGHLRMEITNIPPSHASSEIDVLMNINITYTPPFPIDVIIDPELLKIYQNVFKLLLQINYAEWCVMPLSLMSYQKNGIPGSTILHCFQFELMNFIKLIQAYAKQRVLHCTGADMMRELDIALELDEYVSIHKKYCKVMEEYCLLTWDFATFLSAIKQVLNAGVKFRKLWDRGDVTERELDGIITHVRKCIQFVTNLVKKRNEMSNIPQPQFAWLETALN